MDEAGSTGGRYRELNGTMTLLTLVVWLMHNEHEHEEDPQVIDKSQKIRKADLRGKVSDESRQHKVFHNEIDNAEKQSIKDNQGQLIAIEQDVVKGMAVGNLSIVDKDENNYSLSMFSLIN